MKHLPFRSPTILLLGALGLLLAGCLPRPPTQTGVAPSARAAAATPTTISWSFWGDPWELEVNRRVASAFEAENPSIKLELLHQPWDSYFPWLEERQRAGALPDVMFFSNVRGAASTGQFE